MAGEKDISKENANNNQIKRPRYKEMVFLTGLTGVSVLFGFGFTIASAKKRDPNFFSQGLIGGGSLPESGGALAVRALARGTVYAVAGVGILTYGIWKALGVKNMEELRDKVRGVTPQISHHEPQGRNEFGSVRELVDYIIEEGKPDPSKTPKQTKT